MKMVSSLFKTLFLLGLIALIAFAVQTAQVGAGNFHGEPFIELEYYDQLTIYMRVCGEKLDCNRDSEIVLFPLHESFSRM